MISNFSDPRFSSASWSTDNTSASTLSSEVNFETNKNPQHPILQNEVKIPLDLSKPQPPLPHRPPCATAIVRDSHSNKSGPQYDRWCTTREHNAVFKTSAGFAKHEKEHEDFYVFLPHGPVEETPWGLKCALCETANPTKSHLLHHDILKYDGRLRESTRSRKRNFEELLKRHKTPDENIKILVDKWRKTGKKKAYSCGFCISIFPTLPERTSHVDREHYAKGKNIDEWEETNVIKGLLLQGGVRQECLRLFNPLDPSLMETRISWPPSEINDLRHRLELGAEAATDLAVDVFRSRNSLSLPVCNLRLPPKSIGCIQKPSSTQGSRIYEKGSASDPVQLSDQDSESFESPQVQKQAYSDDTSTIGISLMSVSSPSSKLQSFETNSGYPARSSSLAESTNSVNDSMDPTTENAFGTEQISLAPQMLHNTLPSNDLVHAGLEGPSGSEQSRFMAPMPGYSPYRSSSYTISTTEMALHTTSQLDSFQEDVFPASQEIPIPNQAPKRKLSEKTVQEANLKAQTKAPVSTYNQQYSIDCSKLGRPYTQSAWN